MKPQDIVFLIIFAVLLVLRKDRLCILMGLISFLLAIPLFAKWIFFTAERLIWYSAGFIILGIILMYMQKEKRL